MRNDWRNRVGQILVAIFTIVWALAFFSQCIPRRSDIPVEEMVSAIERDGQDATCSDLIGKWVVLDTSLTMEFKANHRYVGKAGLFSGSWGGYKCDTAGIVTVPGFGCYEDCPSPDVTFYLGQIAGDNMTTTWDAGSNRDGIIRVIVREEGPD